METYRQGDVLLIRTEKLPEGLKAKDNILAYGEVTGHHHKLMGGARVYLTTNGQQVVQVVKPTQLVHEEHGQIEIPEGIYEVRIQREYSPTEKQAGNGLIAMLEKLTPEQEKLIPIIRDEYTNLALHFRLAAQL